MNLGEFIAWAVLTGVPVIGIWALVTGFSNPFDHPRTRDTAFYRGVAANVGNYIGSDERADRKAAMDALVKQAEIAGARPGLPAYKQVARWIKGFVRTYHGNV